MSALRRWLDEKDMTQQGLADLCGVSQATVSEWLSGAIEPRGKNLRKLREVTGLSADELLPPPPARPAAQGAPAP